MLEYLLMYITIIVFEFVFRLLELMNVIFEYFGSIFIFIWMMWYENP